MKIYGDSRFHGFGAAVLVGIAVYVSIKDVPEAFAVTAGFAVYHILAFIKCQFDGIIKAIGKIGEPMHETVNPSDPAHSGPAQRVWPKG